MAQVGTPRPPGLYVGGPGNLIRVDPAGFGCCPRGGFRPCTFCFRLACHALPASSVPAPARTLGFHFERVSWSRPLCTPAGPAVLGGPFSLGRRSGPGAGLSP